MQGLIYIPEELIDVNKENDFLIEDIDELMESIQEYGLLQPLSVMATGDGRYRLLGGERRLTAIRKGLEDGLFPELKCVPCMEVKDINSSLDERILIYEGNMHNRVYRGMEYLDAVAALYELYSQKETSKSKLLEFMSKKLNLKARQVYKLMDVALQADEWIRQAYVDHKISIDTATTIAHMYDLQKQELYRYYLEHGEITPSVVKQYRKKNSSQIDMFQLYGANYPETVDEAAEQPIDTPLESLSQPETSDDSSKPVFIPSALPDEEPDDCPLASDIKSKQDNDDQTDTQFASDAKNRKGAEYHPDTDSTFDPKGEFDAEYQSDTKFASDAKNKPEAKSQSGTNDTQFASDAKEDAASDAENIELAEPDIMNPPDDNFSNEEKELLRSLKEGEINLKDFRENFNDSSEDQSPYSEGLYHENTEESYKPSYSPVRKEADDVERSAQEAMIRISELTQCDNPNINIYLDGIVMLLADSYFSKLGNRLINEGLRAKLNMIKDSLCAI